MKTIIVPTDFSAVALNAAEYAADLALQLHAELKLIHVVQMPLVILDVPVPVENYDASIEDATISMDKLEIRLQQRTKNKVPISGSVVDGSFRTQVMAMMKSEADVWIVMGTTGTGAVDALIFGSYTLLAAREFNRPLIIVPPEARFRKIENMGLACDMKHVSETIPFNAISKLFYDLRARLIVLYVSKPNENMYPSVLAGAKSVQINLARLHPDIRIVTNENVGDGIVNFVHKEAIDLLLLVPKERNFLESLFHKSITKDMVLHPKVPIMIMHY
ncbi:MAG: universal stress protein [Taibaiella sp.]|jgi:nucleotide-binding universal stress UspA family protein